MIRGRTGKISASSRRTEAVIWNRCSYQVPAMVGTNTSTNENQKFYNSTMQSISIGVGGCATKVVALCGYFLDMISPAKTQVENGIFKIFNFRGQTIDVSDQAVFTLKYSVFHDEEGNKIDVSDPITVAQRRSSLFLLFIMMVHPDQDDPN